MHELSITRGIVETCTGRAAGARVLRVTMEIGTLTCVSPDALRFCYEVAIVGTPLEASELEILRIPALARCLACGTDVEMDDLLAACECGSVELGRPRGGDELRIRSMEIEEDASCALPADVRTVPSRP